MFTAAHERDEQRVRDLPAYWMLRMELARERGDAEAVALAAGELSRLGVRVLYEGRGEDSRDN
jgi:hypothetical protein